MTDKIANASDNFDLTVSAHNAAVSAGDLILAEKILSAYELQTGSKLVVMDGEVFVTSVGGNVLVEMRMN